MPSLRVVACVCMRVAEEAVSPAGARAWALEAPRSLKSTSAFFCDSGHSGYMICSSAELKSTPVFGAPSTPNSGVRYCAGNGATVI